VEEGGEGEGFLGHGVCAARCFATTNNLGDESGIPVELNGDEDYANVCRSSPMVTNPPQSISYLDYLQPS
jgi:hypothetical protein